LFFRRGGISRAIRYAISPRQFFRRPVFAVTSHVTVLPGKHPDIFQQIAVIAKATLAD
jgi:hypothetical protein